jgi:predicted DNA-binding transcriptional regulator YafY
MSAKRSGGKGRVSGTIPSSRPPLERMLHIHRALQAGGYPNATLLARELEVSSKSVHRDLEFMRDRLDLPVEFDRRRNGFFYSDKVSSFPTFQITEGELLAMMVAEKALQQYRGTTFERPLMSAFRKLAASLPETVSITLSDWEQTISFRTSAEPILDLAIFDGLARATAGRRQLELAYRKPGRRETEPRVVDPYHLANINGEWFLFGWCHLREDLRTFVPARILAVRETGRTFTRPKGFSLEQRLRDSFGVITGQEEHQVCIRFDDRVADYIREKRWHPSQQIEELEDGRLELRLVLSSLTEVHRWILSWGGQAIPLAPPALVEMVRGAAERLAGRWHGLSEA